MSTAFQKEVLRQLQKNGCDISKPHEFEFFVRLPTRAIATKVAAKMSRSGFLAAKVARADSGNGWLCVAKRLLVPGTADLADHARFFEEIAAAGGGDFEGWEAQVA